MIELKPAVITDDYRKKWNLGTLNDYANVYKDGVKVSDTIYRVGGLGTMAKDGYLILLKHTEAFYDDSITKDPKAKPHLKCTACILNDNGEEKVNFESIIDYPYLTGGRVYSLNSKYFDIETGGYFCDSSTCMKTKEFIFLNNEYDNDESRRGVVKINKRDGTYELIK